MATTCEGTWRDVPPTSEMHEFNIAAVICSGCAEVMVIIRGQAQTFPAGVELTEAVREAATHRKVEA